MSTNPLPSNTDEPIRLTRRFSLAQAREQAIWFCLFVLRWRRS